ncbi:uncharacterized protein LOC131956924 [Physella acuta]|uniref:uncharacterized protein LOC131956924 n=1 Tax=Physella acuta TaxID=109671 RepID=UPI0027DEA647|nr:uncharacterized protein LOC131956924 [Physella acuta]
MSNDGSDPSDPARKNCAWPDDPGSGPPTAGSRYWPQEVGETSSAGSLDEDSWTDSPSGWRRQTAGEVEAEDYHSGPEYDDPPGTWKSGEEKDQNGNHVSDSEYTGSESFYDAEESEMAFSDCDQNDNRWSGSESGNKVEAEDAVEENPAPQEPRDNSIPKAEVIVTSQSDETLKMYRDSKLSLQRPNRFHSRRPNGSRQNNSGKGDYDPGKIRVSKSCTTECEILKPGLENSYPCPDRLKYSSLYEEILRSEQFLLFSDDDDDDDDDELDLAEDGALSESTGLDIDNDNSDSTSTNRESEDSVEDTLPKSGSGLRDGAVPGTSENVADGREIVDKPSANSEELILMPLPHSSSTLIDADKNCEPRGGLNTGEGLAESNDVKINENSVATEDPVSQPISALHERRRSTTMSSKPVVVVKLPGSVKEDAVYDSDTTTASSCMDKGDTSDSYLEVSKVSIDQRHVSPGSETVPPTCSIANPCVPIPPASSVVNAFLVMEENLCEPLGNVLEQVYLKKAQDSGTQLTEGNSKTSNLKMDDLEDSDRGHTPVISILSLNADKDVTESCKYPRRDHNDVYYDNSTVTLVSSINTDVSFSNSGPNEGEPDPENVENEMNANHSKCGVVSSDKNITVDSLARDEAEISDFQREIHVPMVENDTSAISTSSHSLFQIDGKSVSKIKFVVTKDPDLSLNELVVERGDGEDVNLQNTGVKGVSVTTGMEGGCVTTGMKGECLTEAKITDETSASDAACTIQEETNIPTGDVVTELPNYELQTTVQNPITPLNNQYYMSFLTELRNKKLVNKKVRRPPQKFFKALQAKNVSRVSLELENKSSTSIAKIDKASMLQKNFPIGREVPPDWKPRQQSNNSQTSSLGEYTVHKRRKKKDTLFKTKLLGKSINNNKKKNSVSEASIPDMNSDIFCSKASSMSDDSYSIDSKHTVGYGERYNPESDETSEVESGIKDDLKHDIAMQDFEYKRKYYERLTRARKKKSRDGKKHPRSPERMELTSQVKFLKTIDDFCNAEECENCDDSCEGSVSSVGEKSLDYMEYHKSLVKYYSGKKTQINLTNCDDPSDSCSGIRIRRASNNVPSAIDPERLKSLGLDDASMTLQSKIGMWSFSTLYAHKKGIHEIPHESNTNLMLMGTDFDQQYNEGTTAPKSKSNTKAQKQLKNTARNRNKDKKQSKMKSAKSPAVEKTSVQYESERKITYLDFLRSGYALKMNKSSRDQTATDLANVRRDSVNVQKSKSCDASSNKSMQAVVWPKDISPVNTTLGKKAKLVRFNEANTPETSSEKVPAEVVERSEEDTWCYSVNAMLLRANQVMEKQKIRHTDYHFPRPDSAKVVPPVIKPKSSSFLSELLEQDRVEQIRVKGLDKGVKLLDKTLTKRQELERSLFRGDDKSLSKEGSSSKQPGQAIKQASSSEPSTSNSQNTTSNSSNVLPLIDDKHSNEPKSAATLKIRASVSKKSLERTMRMQQRVSTSAPGAHVYHPPSLSQPSILPKRLLPLRYSSPFDAISQIGENWTPVRILKENVAKKFSHVTPEIQSRIRNRPTETSSSFLLDQHSETLRYYRYPHLDQRASSIVQMFADQNISFNNNCDSNDMQNNPPDDDFIDELDEPYVIDMSQVPHRLNFMDLFGRQVFRTLQPINEDPEYGAVECQYDPEKSETASESGSSEASQHTPAESGSHVTAATSDLPPRSSATPSSRREAGTIGNVRIQYGTKNDPDALRMSNVISSLVNQPRSKRTTRNSLISSSNVEIYRDHSKININTMHSMSVPDCTEDYQAVEGSDTDTIDRTSFLQALLGYNADTQSEGCTTSNEQPSDVRTQSDFKIYDTRKKIIQNIEPVVNTAYQEWWLPNYQKIAETKQDFPRHDEVLKPAVQEEMKSQVDSVSEASKIPTISERTTPSRSKYNTIAEVIRMRQELRRIRKQLENDGKLTLDDSSLMVTGTPLTLNKKQCPEISEIFVNKPEPFLETNDKQTGTAEKRRDARLSLSAESVSSGSNLMKISCDDGTSASSTCKQKDTKTCGRSNRSNIGKSNQGKSSERLLPSIIKARRFNTKSVEYPDNSHIDEIYKANVSSHDLLGHDFKRYENVSSHDLLGHDFKRYENAFKNFEQEKWQLRGKQGRSFTWEKVKVPPPFPGDAGNAHATQSWSDVFRSASQASGYSTPSCSMINLKSMVLSAEKEITNHQLGDFTSESFPEMASQEICLTPLDSPELGGSLGCARSAKLSGSVHEESENSHTTEIIDRVSGQQEKQDRSRLVKQGSQNSTSSEITEINDETHAERISLQKADDETDVLQGGDNKTEVSKEDTETKNEMLTTDTENWFGDQTNVQKSASEYERSGDLYRIMAMKYFKQAQFYSHKLPQRFQTRNNLDRYFLKQLRGTDILQTIGLDKQRLLGCLEMVTRAISYIPAFQVRSLKPVEMIPVVIQVRQCGKNVYYKPWLDGCIVQTLPVFCTHDKGRMVERIFTVDSIKEGIYAVLQSEELGQDEPGAKFKGKGIQAARLVLYTPNLPASAFTDNQLYLFAAQVNNREEAQSILVNTYDIAKVHGCSKYFELTCGWVPQCIVNAERQSRLEEETASYERESNLCMQCHDTFKQSERPFVRFDLSVPKAHGENDEHNRLDNSAVYCLKCGDCISFPISHEGEMKQETGTNMLIVRDKFTSRWTISSNGVAIPRNTLPECRRRLKRQKISRMRSAELPSLTPTVNQTPQQQRGSYNVPVAAAKRSVEFQKNFTAMKNITIPNPSLATPNVFTKEWWWREIESLRQQEIEDFNKEYTMLKQIIQEDEEERLQQQRLQHQQRLQEIKKELHQQKENTEVSTEEEQGRNLSYEASMALTESTQEELISSRTNTKNNEDADCFLPVGSQDKAKWVTNYVQYPTRVCKKSNTEKKPQPHRTSRVVSPKAGMEKELVYHHFKNTAKFKSARESAPACAINKTPSKNFKTEKCAKTRKRVGVKRNRRHSDTDSSSSSSSVSLSESSSSLSDDGSGVDSDYLTHHAKTKGPTSIADIFSRTLPKMIIPKKLQRFREIKKKKLEEEALHFVTTEGSVTTMNYALPAIRLNREQGDAKHATNQISDTMLSEYDMCEDADEMRELWRQCFPEVNFFARRKKKGRAFPKKVILA